MKRSILIVTAILGAFLASTLVTACGSGGGGLAVALLIDSNYVDYANPPGDEGYEAYNLQYHLETEGIDHALISGVTSTDFSTALEGKATLIIPEMENGDLASDITPAAAAVITDFVNDGGTLVLFVEPEEIASALANTLFGYSLSISAVAGTIEVGADQIGTIFEGGPATLPELDATYAIEAGTWGMYGSAFFVDPDNNSVVTLIEQSSGTVILLGYDWYDAAPYGSQDGGWVEILNRSIGN